MKFLFRVFLLLTALQNLYAQVDTNLLKSKHWVNKHYKKGNDTISFVPIEHISNYGFQYSWKFVSDTSMDITHSDYIVDALQETFSLDYPGTDQSPLLPNTTPVYTAYENISGFTAHVQSHADANFKIKNNRLTISNKNLKVQFKILSVSKDNLTVIVFRDIDTTISSPLFEVLKDTLATWYKPRGITKSLKYERNKPRDRCCNPTIFKHIPSWSKVAIDHEIKLAWSYYELGISPGDSILAYLGTMDNLILNKFNHNYHNFSIKKDIMNYQIFLITIDYPDVSSRRQKTMFLELLDKKKHQQFDKEYQELIKKHDPKTYYGHLLKAALYAKYQMYFNALQELDYAIQSEPNNFNLRHAKLSYLLNQKSLRLIEK